MTEGAAWTKSGKNQSGGLNEKGRRSYEREQFQIAKHLVRRVTRRASFCARMKGMKKTYLCPRLQEILILESISLLEHGTVVTNQKQGS